MALSTLNGDATRRAGLGLAAGLCMLGSVSSAVSLDPTTHHPALRPMTQVDPGEDRPVVDDPSAPAGPHSTVELAFAGDLHFQLQLAALLDHPRGALGPAARPLAEADLAMVNLESAIAEAGRAPAAKELEDPSRRFHFRTSPAALELLDAAGVDVVSMVNNHGADYGRTGLRDTLRAVRRSPIHVVGVGMNRRAAFAAYRVSVGGTAFAFLAADASMREGSSNVWAAGPTTPGIAAAHADRPRALTTAVREASRRGDVVVVYMHWGEELRHCPTSRQRITARALADAGADVIVGSHAHVLLGSGWFGTTYVNYGLGNFLWYHDHQPETGVLRLTVRDGHVVDDAWAPARIHGDGRPLPLTGPARVHANAAWRALRSCTGLAAEARWPIRRRRPVDDHQGDVVVRAFVRKHASSCLPTRAR
ncbi:CapA family protein [Nocardioides sp. JQ2195]|uniref:CapA family protein n=1 Tax=Nocardioides sp. JQ2195 TaxID=2592334 RepID=UPI00143ECE49|nr:CapA family protein [Nocardioides sp. JQ2195]QIX26435.1 CapA family protein [Nocardioides sp. JQ2195]